MTLAKQLKTDVEVFIAKIANIIIFQYKPLYEVTNYVTNFLIERITVMKMSFRKVTILLH